jgi:orotate phosphoribosyltransferase
VGGGLADRVFAACHLEGRFVLRSGEVSGEYFDKYLFESDPDLLGCVADAMLALLPPCDALGGMEMGGIPLVTALSQRTGLPAVFVRKVAKPYGTCKAVEGVPVAGLRVVAVEDVVTRAGALVAGCEHLRAAGELSG